MSSSKTGSQREDVWGGREGPANVAAATRSQLLPCLENQEEHTDTASPRLPPQCFALSQQRKEPLPPRRWGTAQGCVPTPSENVLNYCPGSPTES